MASPPAASGAGGGGGGGGGGRFSVSHASAAAALQCQRRSSRGGAGDWRVNRDCTAHVISLAILHINGGDRTGRRGGPGSLASQFFQRAFGQAFARLLQTAACAAAARVRLGV
jgi:hypothetical protein